MNSQLRIQMIRATVAVALAVVAAKSGALDSLERLAFDEVIRNTERRVEPRPWPESVPDALVVAIDRRSLRQNSWPWSRSKHAQLVDILDAAGARAIAFDIDFAPPRDQAGDQRFADAIRKSGRVVLGVVEHEFSESSERGRNQSDESSRPLPLFASVAAGQGHVMLPIDGDGAIRRGPRPMDIGGREYQPLANVALEVAGVPHAAASLAWIDHRRPFGPLETLSALDVLNGDLDVADVRGRVVFVGATAPLLQDLWRTPLDPLEPGVLIQARAFRGAAAAAAGAAVLRDPAPIDQALVLFGFVASAFLATQLPERLRRLGLFGLGACWVVGAVFGALHFDRVFPVVGPLFAIGLMYVFDLEQVRRVFGERVDRQERSLGALANVGKVTLDSPGDPSLEVALGLLADVVDASGVALLRTSREGELDGRRIEWRRKTTRSVGNEEHAERVAALGVMESLVDPGRGRSIYVPLRVRSQSLGVLILERTQDAPLDDFANRTIASVASQLSLTAENLNLIDDLRGMADATIVSLATAIESRDGYTEMHCRRLGVLSVRVAERLGLSEQDVRDVRLGAMLHDVGKIGVPDSLLLKAGRFSDAERLQMQSHTEMGHRIVSPIPGLQAPTVACVRNHHECFDGSGYPDALAGEEIPLAARIVSVVDVWDALSSARPYKPAYPAAKVRAILQKGRGSSFDPAVLDLFLRILDEEGEELELLLERAVLLGDIA